MIPKIIHYCWFGRNTLPDDVREYIATWKKYCPDYEIKEWNESNFNINCCSYVKEAYNAKKWAFIADYARFFILYNYGGIYFDTDVELLRPIDTLVENGNFMGLECHGNGVAIAPGLGLGAVSGLPLYKRILDVYDNLHFKNADGTFNTKTVVEYVTEIFKEQGYIPENKLVKVYGIYIYPVEYFCPLNSVTGKISITEKTYSIHHYAGSWLDWENKFFYAVKRKFAGRKCFQVLLEVLFLPLRICGKIRVLGLKNTCKLFMEYMVENK